LGGHPHVSLPLCVGVVMGKYRAACLIPPCAFSPPRCAFNCLMTLKFAAVPGLTTPRYPIKLAVSRSLDGLHYGLPAPRTWEAGEP
jgi:hypothetical protein